MVCFTLETPTLHSTYVFLQNRIYEKRWLQQKYDGCWDVHFWLGKNASTDEIGVAAIKTVEIDDVRNASRKF